MVSTFLISKMTRSFLPPKFGVMRLKNMWKGDSLMLTINRVQKMCLEAHSVRCRYHQPICCIVISKSLYLRISHMTVTFSFQKGFINCNGKSDKSIIGTKFDGHMEHFKVSLAVYVFIVFKLNQGFEGSCEYRCTFFIWILRSRNQTSFLNIVLRLRTIPSYVLSIRQNLTFCSLFLTNVLLQVCIVQMCTQLPKLKDLEIIASCHWN